jgi:hypothetical protein
MSLPIRETPILTGKDAKRFAENAKNPKPVPREDYERALRTYEEMQKNKDIF